MSKQFSLDHLVSFSIEGSDAREFSQSQFTVGVDSLTRDRWFPLAWCEPRGRVLAFMMGRASENGVDLVLPASLADSVSKRLALFTIGRSVEISAPAPVAGSFDADSDMPPLANDESRAMSTGAQAPADAAELHRWRTLDLCQGLPWLEPDSSAQHLPQWLGLERLGALVYDKGCYPGQEVIARLHYRGSLKYRLAGLRLDSNAAIPAQARITDKQGNVAGHWLDGLEQRGVTIGLGVISTRIEDGIGVLIQLGDREQFARVTPPETLC